MTPILIKSLAAGAAVRGNRIVTFDGNGAAVEADADTKVSLGIADSLGAAAAGQMVDVVLIGRAEVRLGGNVAIGVRVTSDAEGRAVAVPAPAVAAKTVAVIGIALAGGVEGDIVPILLAPMAVHVPAA